ncbi:MAG TPA: hypothetical protein VF286_03820, partial [Acidiphilium sp.]
MNDVFERRRTQQGRQVVSYFPPEPWLELRDGLGVYLILPHSLATHDIRRFQVAGTAGWHRDYLGELGLDRLLDALKHGHPVIGGLGNEV